MSSNRLHSSSQQRSPLAVSHAHVSRLGAALMIHLLAGLGLVAVSLGSSRSAIATPASDAPAHQVSSTSFSENSLDTWAIAQASPAAASTRATTANLLFVNPTLGQDSADGSAQSPLRSLTRALAVAQPGTTIVLAAGTYEAATGEQFPIRLRSDITVQGDPSRQGEGILIRGGGDFVSPTAARQNIAILGANQAMLTGVTVTNPNPRGYGVWVESSSPILINNTFTGNVHDGVSVNGASSPLIQRNRFISNGANGVTVFGNSRPRIQDNLFEQTGYGINIGDQATPLLISNRIVNNRSGVVVQERARPVLRQNVIADNQQSGVVAIAQAQPDMGRSDEPGENQFSNNGIHDINAEVATAAIFAVGNQLSQSRIVGSVDVDGSLSGTPVAIAPQPSRSSGSGSSSMAIAPASAPAAPSSGPAPAPQAVAIPNQPPSPVTPRPVAPAASATAAQTTAARATAAANPGSGLLPESFGAQIPVPELEASEPSEAAAPEPETPATGHTRIERSQTPPSATRPPVAADPIAPGSTTAQPAPDPASVSPAADRPAAPTRTRIERTSPSTPFPRPQSLASSAVGGAGQARGLGGEVLPINEYVSPREMAGERPETTVARSQPSARPSTPAPVRPSAPAPAPGPAQGSGPPTHQPQAIALTVQPPSQPAAPLPVARLRPLNSAAPAAQPQAQPQQAIAIPVLEPPTQPPAVAAASNQAALRPAFNRTALLPSQSQTQPQSSPSAIPIRVILPPETSLNLANQQATTALQPTARPTPAQSPAMAAQTASTSPSQVALRRNPNLLPVPSADVPYGHVGDRSRIRVDPNPLASRIAPGTNRAQMLGLRYRVLVDASDPRAERLVQSLAPGAFRTSVGGRSVMQAGAYASLENANDMARRLASQGLRVAVQEMN